MSHSQHSGGRSKRSRVQGQPWLQTAFEASLDSMRFYLKNIPAKQINKQKPKTATKGSYFLVFLMQAPGGSSWGSTTGLEEDFEQCLRNSKLGQCLNPQTQISGHLWMSESLRMPFWHCFPETCALNFVTVILKDRTVRTEARLGGLGRNKKT